MENVSSIALQLDHSLFAPEISQAYRAITHFFQVLMIEFAFETLYLTHYQVFVLVQHHLELLLGKLFSVAAIDDI